MIRFMSYYSALLWVTRSSSGPCCVRVRSNDKYVYSKEHSALIYLRTEIG